MTQAGILDQLEVVLADAPPQSRNFGEPPPTTAADGEENDQFGFSVAVDGDRGLVGANGADVGGAIDQGAAYVFVRDETGWNQEAKLIAVDGSVGDNFGGAVALDGDTAVIGAFGAFVGTEDTQGAAYVFTRTGTTWTQQDKLVAADGASGDSFGNPVALVGDVALVGARFADVGTEDDQGAVYIFIHNGTAWVQQDKLIAEDGNSFDYFGDSVAISGNTAVVGVTLFGYRRN